MYNIQSQTQALPDAGTYLKLGNMNYNQNKLKMQRDLAQLLEQDSEMCQEQSQVIVQGLPTQMELDRQHGLDFGSKKSNAEPQDKKFDDKKTDDVEEEKDIAPSSQFRVAQQNFFEEEDDEVDSNPDSSTTQKQIQELQQMQEEIQKQTKPVSQRRKKKKIKKNRKNSARSKKQKLELGSETKNIPKNYGKQIIKFIKKEKKLTQRVLLETGSKLTYEKLNLQLKIKKKSLNKITDLKKLWGDYQYSKEVRILSSIFLRRYCFQWIFNSRIQKIKFPIKYRYKIIEGVQNPKQFEYLKDF